MSDQGAHFNFTCTYWLQEMLHGTEGDSSIWMALNGSSDSLLCVVELVVAEGMDIGQISRCRECENLWSASHAVMCSSHKRVALISDETSFGHFENIFFSMRLRSFIVYFVFIIMSLNQALSFIKHWRCSSTANHSAHPRHQPPVTGRQRRPSVPSWLRASSQSRDYRPGAGQTGRRGRRMKMITDRAGWGSL